MPYANSTTGFWPRPFSTATVVSPLHYWFRQAEHYQLRLGRAPFVNLFDSNFPRASRRLAQVSTCTLAILRCIRVLIQLIHDLVVTISVITDAFVCYYGYARRPTVGYHSTAAYTNVRSYRLLFITISTASIFASMTTGPNRQIETVVTSV